MGEPKRITSKDPGFADLPDSVKKRVLAGEAADKKNKELVDSSRKRAVTQPPEPLSTHLRPDSTETDAQRNYRNKQAAAATKRQIK